MGDKRLIQLEDLANITHSDAPQISPDGRFVAFVRTQPSLESNGYKNTVWLAPTDGTPAYPLTFSDKDTQPQWSPDGKWLAFVSARAGKPQLYLLPMQAHGEAVAITQHPNGISSPQWSPDGTHIAYLARVNAHERAIEDGDTSLKPATDDSAHFDPLRVTRLPYREGTTYHDGRYSQIYALNVATRTSRRLTSLDAHYTTPAWSSDSTAVFTTRIVALEGDEYWRKSSIYRIDLANGQETKLLEGQHTLGGLATSPNGKWLAFQQRDGRDAVSHFNFCVMPSTGGKLTILNDSLDRPINGFVWGEDDDHLLLNVATEGVSEILWLTISTRLIKSVAIQPCVITNLDARAGAIACSVSTHLNPSELYVKATRKVDFVPVTSFNAAFLESVHVQPAQEVVYDNGDGVMVQGWYLLPPNYEEGTQYPLAVNIHGGPHIMWSCHDRSMWHEWQLHAANGYVVFYCNPRGSEGYGNDFLHALGTQWGEVAMQDIMAGIDTIISKGVADEDRLAITGGSYGGYMVGWIIAHTNRFKVAVAQRGVYNVVSFYGTTDIPTFAESEFQTTAWADPDFLWSRSPLAYTQTMQTPLLLIHSENDFRVPIEQSEQLFAYLRLQGKTVEMVRFPREGHELSRSGEPKHRVRRLSEMVGWWNKTIFPQT